jgi:hypothetical protein
MICLECHLTSKALAYRESNYSTGTVFLHPVTLSSVLSFFVMWIAWDSVDLFGA